ncbi:MULTISPECIES: glutamine-hydrolyzing GMP synthase [Treponema]|uniref:GMP synthase (glutamine-hydrolyzing) n=1 Tax=Treponema succinifaciens (strain ATCC 33096 / DSM 2489 / 6091) TaxID=869209 RepID=F2NW60_TRES6|nr:MULTISPECIES: glutamine-hydrolyzing GMP synthase [Treponema]AEB14915.1 GMP synthase, small subunit [Treponema succinifaciens DSM 2489]MCI6913593.1 glutamine-hydrolyzing GMP synthase [Treponema succinifaciens]MDY2616565.1 glutamine-hydrolyzing GMP synthase [Treponema succinifaciens]
MERLKIVVLDFGSQYAHLIAKRFRMMGYYSEIALPSAGLETFKNAKGIVLSGGPSSIYDKNAPEFNSEILKLDIPILGLCYGHYVLQTGYNGKAQKALVGEFGFATLELNQNVKCPLFEEIASPQQVWMSHQDAVVKPGDGFETVGSTKDCEFAALQNLEKKRFSLQFHCEVKDTPCGNKILENFAKFCGMEKNWDQDTVLNHIIDSIKNQADDKNVLLFLSGGVDSTVAFALLNKALGQKRVLGLHIDNGFMRKNESKKVEEAYKNHGFSNFIVEDASKTFLKAVENLTDPQKKRMAIGENFITVRNEVVAKQKFDENKWLLAQGTLYPDIIESGGTKNSNVIKTHHNRVDGIQKLIEKGLIIEPLKDLYKDEVRAIGKKLGLEDELVMRHPFPGPGLSINVLCSNGTMTDNDKEEFKKAQEEISKVQLEMFCEKCSENLEKYILPVKSVGVQGDFRTYRFPSVISFAKTENGFYHLPKKWEKLEAASSQITNSASFINRTIIRLWQNPSVKDEALKLQEGYCTKDRLDQTRDADDIVLTALHKSGWYNKIFQHLTINLPYASSKERCSFVLRPLCSEDVMTARFAQLPQNLLMDIVQEISKLPYVDAIFFDLTNKPPATFGWE